MKCKYCETVNHSEAVCCSFCGAIVNAEQSVDCDNHTNIPAVAFCTICGKPVCGDCSVRRNGYFYCEDERHASLRDTHNLVLKCDSIFSADLIVKNLSASMIPSQSFVPRSSDFFDLDMNSSESAVYVQKELAEHALEVLNDLDLIDFTSRKRMHGH